MPVARYASFVVTAVVAGELDDQRVDQAGLVEVIGQACALLRAPQPTPAVLASTVDMLVGVGAITIDGDGYLSSRPGGASS